MGLCADAPESDPHINLADALFPITRQRVLALLFGHPERSFFTAELIRLTGGGSGAIQRELARLSQSGLVVVTRIGNQKHYQANPESPIFTELRAIVQKTIGLTEPLREALAPLAAYIDTAFVYGSVAKRTDTADSDIDLMVISDTLSYAELFATLESVSMRLGRSINPTIYSKQEFLKRLENGNAFIRRVLEQPKIRVIGDDHDIGTG